MLVTWSLGQSPQEHEQRLLEQWPGTVVVAYSVVVEQGELADPARGIFDHPAHARLRRVVVPEHVSASGGPLLSRPRALNGSLAAALSLGAERVAVVDPTVRHSGRLWDAALGCRQGEVLGETGKGLSGTLVGNAEAFLLSGGLYTGYCRWGWDDFDLRAQMLGGRVNHRWHLEDLGGEAVAAPPVAPPANWSLYDQRLSVLLSGLSSQIVKSRHPLLAEWLGLG